jgi:hypothetical protein
VGVAPLEDVNIQRKPRLRRLFGIWLRDWKFPVMMITVIVPVVLNWWLESYGTVSYGVVGPYPLPVSELYQYDSSSLTRVLEPLGIPITSSQRNEITNAFLNLLDSSKHIGISVGTWFICPDSSCTFDSLWVSVRSSSGRILAAYVINSTADSIHRTLGQDPESICFRVPALAKGEQLSLMIVTSGLTEAPYKIGFPKGNANLHLLRLGAEYPREFLWVRYALVFAAGLVVAWLGHTLMKETRKVHMSGSIEDLPDEATQTEYMNQYGLKKESNDGDHKQ